MKIIVLLPPPFQGGQGLTSLRNAAVIKRAGTAPFFQLDWLPGATLYLVALGPLPKPFRPGSPSSHPPTDPRGHRKEAVLRSTSVRKSCTTDREGQVPHSSGPEERGVTPTQLRALRQRRGAGCVVRALSPISQSMWERRSADHPSQGPIRPCPGAEVSIS